MIIPELLDFVSIVDWHVEVETVNNSPLSEISIHYCLVYVIHAFSD